MGLATTGLRANTAVGSVPDSVSLLMNDESKWWSSEVAPNPLLDAISTALDAIDCRFACRVAKDSTGMQFPGRAVFAMPMLAGEVDSHIG